MTRQEWNEFETHFDKREVELGNCARPYAAACDHEHSCIRCPMLQVVQGILDRLEEIHIDLVARRAHAETQGWLGELEGIDLTLRFLADERTETLRFARLDYGPTVLGMPMTRAPA